MPDTLSHDERSEDAHPAPVSPPRRDGDPWRQLAVVTVMAAATIVVADRALAVLAPTRQLREVWDAVADHAMGDPDIIVLGSSHARTFDAVGHELSRRTAGDVSLVAVPLEFGRVTGYRWVFEERLLPLIDERNGEGRLVRPSLSRFVVVTDWWDSCHWSSPLTNLPARAWTLRHFLADVRQQGLTPFNRNYMASLWTRLGSRSALLGERGLNRLPGLLRERVAPASDDVIRQRFDKQVAEWRLMIEEGEACIGDERELSALRAIITALQARKIEPTILLYPRMPATVSPAGRATTLDRFSRIARNLGSDMRIRIVDLTSDSPLTDDDFADDFDHVLPEGNRRFARWVLDGPLAYLLETPARAPAAPDSGRGRAGQ